MSHEGEVRRVLNLVRRRCRALSSLNAVMRAAAAVAVIVAVVAAIERVWRSAAPSALAAVAVGGLLGVVAALGWAFWPLRRGPGDRQIARLVEERCPQLEDRLAAAAELEREPSDSPLARLLLADAAASVRELDLDSIVSARAMRRSALKAALAVGVLALAMIFAAGPVLRVGQAVSLYAFPGRLTLHVTPGDLRVVAGEPVRIEAQVLSGARPAAIAIPSITIGSGETARMVAMTSSGDGYVFELTSVEESFVYRVAAATLTSAEYTVTALHPPNVTRIDVAYEYPAFIGLAPRLEEDGGDIYAPVGTDVQLRVHTDKPVTEAVMTMSDGQRIVLAANSDGTLGASYEVEEDASYRVALADGDGLTNPGEVEYFIRTMDDRPPDVRILRPAGDRQVTSLEEVEIEARADDDYGVERFELVLSVRGGPEKVIPFGGPANATSRTGRHLVYMEELGVEPGDFVAYYARARDVSRAKRSTEARSDIFFLEVKPFDEEFVAAQSQSGMSGGDRSLDDLVAAQKEIIIATWKLERRSSGGTSQQDIRSVARAQAELKVRAEQAARALGRRGSQAFRRRVSGAPAEEDATPMSHAVRAMGQAHEALERLKTGAALPHEMEAYNQLLRAQAEVRRRQVARQQANAGGGGGSSRPGQDMSALFDRELQRQTETNYENRTTATSASQPERSDALDEVRELARRQDELARQQQELARRQSSLEDAEIKRQLERLTREQSELRRRAEELSQQLARDGRNQSSPGGQSGEEGSTQPLREASEEMRNAAGDLRKQDAQQASASSGRALEKLRQLERQLRAARPGERGQALAELQIEAQQLADAQGRAAAEAARLDAQRTPGDALRRMAGEKERMADRAERLEAGMRQLAQAGSQPEREALAEVAQELERQAVGQRLRQHAEQLRQAGAPEEGNTGQDLERFAEKERELATALDRVAEKMGSAAGAPDAESRELSRRLARARDLRRTLEGLERQIDELAQSDQAQGRGRPQAASERPQEGSSPQPADRAQGSQAAHGSASQEGQQAGQTSGGDIGRELQRLREEYDRQLRESQELLSELQGQNSGTGGTPEQHEYSMGAPGTEAFKQDYERWDTLRRDVRLALERLETGLSQQLAERETRNRLNAGADDRTPDEYKALVEKYYESLASRKRN